MYVREYHDDLKNAGGPALTARSSSLLTRHSEACRCNRNQGNGLRTISSLHVSPT